MEGPLGIICPICGREVSSKDLPSPEDTIKIIGLDHGDHVLIIKYDKFGVIRDYSTYYWSKSEETGVEVECPECGRKEKIESSEYPAEFAFKHEGHVFLVNAISDDLILPETMPLIVPREEKEAMSIETILEEIGSNGLASIIVLSMCNSKEIQVPSEYMESIKIFLEEIGFNNVKIKDGDLVFLPDEEIVFLKNLIERNREKPSSLITKLTAAVKLLKKIEDIIYEAHKNGKLDKGYMDLIDLLKRKKTYALLARIMKEKYEIEI